jgi:hypothetical protein
MTLECRLEELAEELLRSRLISPALPQDIGHVAVLISRPPQIGAFAVDGEEGIVEMSCVARPGTSAAQRIRIRVLEFLAPIAHRLVRQQDTASGHELFDVPVAEAEAEIQPHAVTDDRHREPMALVGIGGGSWGHVASMPHETETGKVERLI